ncbi:hypothetical protein SVIO_087980 [Streptomyces violaceusniger]|uniref:Condensation domain-containing protein n=1 Tax=Streptomyces violaceusniger TaxID=68280 RepID=A0A4D4LAN0_STRVO|nr:hypothetical protein SVIO_087980 [Streptomyces violaceusniger]
MTSEDVTGAGPALGRAVKRVKEQLRAVPDQGLGYGLLRHLNPRIGPRLAALPTPDIGFNYLGRFTEADREEPWMPSATDDGGVLSGAGDDAGLPPAHVLELNAVTVDTSRGPCLTATWSWAEGTLTRPEVDDLAHTWFRVLRAITEHADRPGAGGLTPSDVKPAALTQEVIERLEAACAPAALSDILPLTPLQEGLLFHALYDARATDDYVVQLGLDLDGPLDHQALREAAEALLRRHPNLRAGFWHEGLERPVQAVPATVALPWQEIDLRQPNGDRQREELRAVAAAERNRRFEPTAPPLLRLTLIRLGDHRHHLLLTHHHLLLDGWSLPVVMRDLFQLYRNRAEGGAGELPPVTLYRDFLTWLAERDERDRGAAETAWRQVLDGVEGPTLIAPAAGPPDAPRPLRRS